MTALERNGIIFHWKETVQECAAEKSGAITLEFASRTSLTVDAVLVAAGRQSNTENLGLTQAGVTTGKRGIIPVDPKIIAPMCRISTRRVMSSAFRPSPRPAWNKHAGPFIMLSD